MTTIAPRVFLSHFALANPLYAEARLYAYVADVSTGRATTTLATLYRAPTGTEEEANPFRLDGDGKLTRPVYVDGPVVVRAHPVGSTPVHDTGALALGGVFRNEWVPEQDYAIGDTVRDGRFSENSNRLYIAAVAHRSGSNFTSDVAASRWRLYVDASQPVDYDDTILSAPTGYFFEADGARVHRLNDRLLLGAATAADGSTLGGGVGADWFSAGTGISAGLSWVTYLSTVALVTQNGTIGFSAASRASDVPSGLGTRQISIPFVGIAIMDRTGGGPPYWTSYGAYFEARMEPVAASTGTVIGIEIDAINFGVAAGEPTPSRLQTLGGATALWLASGGDPANHGRSIGPAQLAIGIVPNGETFEAGIVFHAEAIEGTDGTTGFGPAIRMATRHLIDWWAPGTGPTYGERTTFITSTATGPVASLQFQDGGTILVTPGGKMTFGVTNVADAVNGLGVVPAVLGETPYFEAFGDNSNVPIRFKPKGTGDVQVVAPYLLFYSAVGNQLSGLVNNVTDTTRFNTLQFNDDGQFFYGRGGIVVAFGMVANPTSYLAISNAAAGNALSIAATGTGDIDILLDPLGSNGTLKLGVPTASSASVGGATALPGQPAGYFVLKDAGGATAKVPYWNT